MNNFIYSKNKDGIVSSKDRYNKFTKHDFDTLVAESNKSRSKVIYIPPFSDLSDFNTLGFHDKKLVIQRGCVLPRVVFNSVIGDNCEAHTPSTAIHNSVILGTIHQAEMTGQEKKTHQHSLKLKNSIADRIHAPGSLVILDKSSSAREISAAKGLKLVDSVVGSAFVLENAVLGKGSLLMGEPNSTIMGSVIMEGPCNTIAGRVDVLGKHVGLNNTNVPIVVSDNYTTNRIFKGQINFDVDKLIKPLQNKLGSIRNPATINRGVHKYMEIENSFKPVQALNFRENNINHSNTPIMDERPKRDLFKALAKTEEIQNNIPDNIGNSQSQKKNEKELDDRQPSFDMNN